MKKTIKILSLSLFLLIFTGCEATYNLEINETTFSENIDITVPTSEINNNLYEESEMTYQEYTDYQLDTYYPAKYNDYKFNPYEMEDGIKQEDVEYYDQSLINDSNNYGIRYSYKFDINDFVNSKAINTCFKEFSVSKNDQVYTLRTNYLARCFDNYKSLDTLRINLKLNYDIIYQNADQVNKNDNIYTWILTKDNYQGKYITISYNLSKNANEEPIEPSNPNEPDEPTQNPNETPTDNPSNQEQEKNEKNNLLSTILVIAIVLIFLIGIFGFIKYKSIRS